MRFSIDHRGALWDAEAPGVAVMAWTREEAVRCAPAWLGAAGDVLVLGLGVGLVLGPLLARDQVRGVLVLEKHPAVVALVAPSLPADPRLAVELGDAFTWEPAPGRGFDRIWLDLWTSPRESEAYTAAGVDQSHDGALARLSRWLRPGGRAARWCDRGE